MEAFFDARNHPKIKLAVSGARRTSLLEAVLDTGFDGYLSLPITIAVTLGIELTAIVPVEYADGRKRHLLPERNLLREHRYSQNMKYVLIFQDKRLTLREFGSSFSRGF